MRASPLFVAIQLSLHCAARAASDYAAGDAAIPFAALLAPFSFDGVVVLTDGVDGLTTGAAAAGAVATLAVTAGVAA